jgi:hypothetical protein
LKGGRRHILLYLLEEKKRKRGEQPESLLEAGFVMHSFSANIE